MNRRNRKQTLVAEINITPFTDVILVLLVIFMITTPLISQLGLKVKLPESKTGKQIEAAKQAQVTVTITNEGTLYLEDKLVTRKELKGKIDSLYRYNPNLSVILRSDKFVQFKNVVNVLDTLNELGIKNLNIAATAE